MGLFGNLFNNDTDTGYEPVAPATPAAAPSTPAPTEGAPAPEPELTGIDRYLKMLDNDEKGKEGQSNDPAPEPFDPTKLLSDPELLSKITDSVDYTKAISKATQEKLASNADDALISLVQDVGKASYTDALKHSAALSQKYVDEAIQRALATSQSQTQESISDLRLKQVMPEMENPVIRMGLEGMKAKILQQTPTISPEDLAAELRGFYKSANDIVNPSKPPEEKNKPRNAAATSWIDWAQDTDT